MQKPNQLSKNNSKANLQELKELLGSYLAEQGIDTKSNFTCLNPNHKDKNPSMTYYPDSNTVYCHGCSASFDIFDLYAIQQMNVTPDTANHVTPPNGFKDLYNRLADYMHVDVGKFKVSPQDAERAKINEFNSRLIKIAAQNHDKEKADYLKRRGISPELAKKFNLGYIPNWVNPTAVIQKGQNPKPTPRLIIPTGESSYLARDTRQDIPKEEKPFEKQKQGSAHIFNVEALLDDSKPVFIVEGEFDALSIMEVTKDAEAVALGSTSNVDLFCKILRKIKNEKLRKGKPYDPELLIAMDNDDAGNLASNDLEMQLNSSELNVINYVVNIAKSSKDANEELISNRQKFAEEVKSRIKDPDNYLAGLVQRISARKDTPQYVPTGYSNLDKLLDGGLYPQLYVLGAVSSLGKTTFVMQIADRIASRQHKPVFYFSLETSKDELTEKNLSRLSFEYSSKIGGNPQTARSINNGYWLDHKKEFKLINSAIDAYSKYYSNIHVFDGTLNRPTANDIYQRVKSFRRKHPDVKPVVIVDYLQILKPINDRDTDKEKVTKSIAAFKSIASELEIPVIVISSFNRSSYMTSVEMTSFKESGEIEYYADTLIGLQYRVMSDEDDLDDGASVAQQKEAQHKRARKLKKARTKDPRQIEAVVLKNRNGAAGKSAYFDYYPKFNSFVANGISND